PAAGPVCCVPRRSRALRQAPSSRLASGPPRDDRARSGRSGPACSPFDVTATPASPVAARAEACRERATRGRLAGRPSSTAAAASPRALPATGSSEPVAVFGRTPRQDGPAVIFWGRAPDLQALQPPSDLPSAPFPP